MLVAIRFGDDRLLSRIIAWWQRNDASHCEVVIETIGDAYRCASSSWVDGGVRIMVNSLPASKWRLYEIDRDIELARAWLVEHKGCGYDYLGLFGFVIRPLKGWSGRWFCSEAVAAMLGLPDPWRFNVADIEGFCISTGRRIQ